MIVFRDKSFRHPLIPAKAGIQAGVECVGDVLPCKSGVWIPAFAGMSGVGE